MLGRAWGGDERPLRREIGSSVAGVVGGRIHELRQVGYHIEVKGTGPKAQYRLIEEVSGAAHDSPAFACGCGWNGREHQIIHVWDEKRCPRCGGRM